MNTSNLSDRPSESDRVFDAVVVGSGICGSLAASILGGTGYKVCLVDRHAVYPPDFRAEHLDGPQIDQLRRLGFLDRLTDGLYRGETVTLARAGRIVGTGPTVNYGLCYDLLVNRARSSPPPSVQCVTARAATIEASDTLQRVMTSDGRVIQGRLLILATGQGYALCKQVGISRSLPRAAHSLTFGFNIDPLAASRLNIPSLSISART